MPPFTTVDELLRHVESLSHRERCARLVEVGRSAVDAASPQSVAVQAVVATLGQPSAVHYHRLLAGYALRGALADTRQRGGELPAALLATAQSLLRDRSNRVSRLLMTPMLEATAAPTGAPLLDGNATVELLRDARVQQFKGLCQRLCAASKTPALWQLCTTPRAVTDPKKAQVLLGSLSPSEFERLPEEQQMRLGSAALRLLCGRHPQWIAQHLVARVQKQQDASGTVDPALTALVQSSYEYLVKSGAAQHGLHLFLATAHHLALPFSFAKDVLRRHYLLRFPVEVGTYLLDGDGRAVMATLSGPLRLTPSRRCVKRLSGHRDLLLRLLEAQVFAGGTSCLPTMSVEDRRVFFRTRMARLEDRRGILQADAIRYVPAAADRISMARKFFAHKELVSEPAQRIAYLRFLPFTDATELGAAFVASSDADLRCCVIGALLKSLPAFRTELPAALEFCAKRTKEQDPWRTAMFSAWAALPSTFWMRTAAHTPDAEIQATLLQMMESAFAARDVSSQTLKAIEAVLCKLVVAQPDFAVAELVKLIRKRLTFAQYVSATDVFASLPHLCPPTLRVVAARLLPLADAMPLLGSSASTNVALSILTSLLERRPVAGVVLGKAVVPGSEAPDAEQLGTEVRRLLQVNMTSRSSSLARAALRWYARYFAVELRAELPALLAANKDWATVSEVQNLVCSAMQGPLLDLLVRPIRGTPTGRFYNCDSGGAPPAVLVELPLAKAHRWTAQQQEQYALSSLDLLYSSVAVDMHKLSSQLESVPRLPSVRADLEWTDGAGNAHSLVTMATEGHPMHGDYARRCALQALGCFDGDDSATATLQAALDDAEFRVDALRALTKSLQNTSSAEVVRVMEPVLMSRQVTAQKEALRLIGARGDDVAYARLVRFAGERHLPMPVEADKADVATPESAAAPTGAEQMHHDVRAALVGALFHFRDRAQVWAFYKAVARQGSDYVASSGMEGQGASAAAVSGTPSAACEAMIKIPWAQLWLPWQVCEYRHLLRQLLQHPEYPIRRAAVERLSEVPPYEDVELCTAVLAAVADMKDNRGVVLVLRCALACTAPEAEAATLTAIVDVKSDALLKRLTAALAKLVESARTHDRPRLCGVVDSVITRLAAMRRQPGAVVTLIFVLDMCEWAARFVMLDAAGILHPGAAADAIRLLHPRCGLITDVDTAITIERETLRTHPCAFVRRFGLAVLMLTRAARGRSAAYDDALATYCADSDLWVSSDACAERDDVK